MIDVGSAVGYLLLDASGFESGFDKAMKSMKTFENESSTVGDKFSAMGSAMTSVGSSLTKSVTLPIVGIGTAAVAAASSFESSMSQVQATLGIGTDAISELNGETVNTMDALSDLAKELGESTKFSATEAADAINNMAMAGYRTQEIYDTLPQVLNLASAGCLDLDYATQLVANGLNVMGLSTDDAAEFADKLAVTASNAYGSVSDFGEGILIAGAQAKLANVSLTDTYTALGILGDNGISASEGGTYLRNTLKNLYTPTTDAAEALDELGVKTSNSDGTLRDFQTVLQDLGGALDGLSEEERITMMSRIFDTRTISAANALIENSTDRWDELSDAIDNANGAAEQMAETQLDNLQGQLTILKSALEGLAISFGEIIIPVLTDMVKGIAAFVGKLNSMDDGTKKLIIVIATIAAAIGPLLLIFGKLAISISAIIGLIGGTGGLTAAIGLLAGPLGIVIAAVAALAAAWTTDFGNIREYTATIWESIKSIFSSAWEFITELWDNDFNHIRSIATTVWEDIEILFGTALQVISDLFQAFAALLSGDWETLWESLKDIFVSIWDAIVSLAENFWELIVQMVTDIAEPLFEAGKNAFNRLKDGFTEVWDTIKEWIEKIKEDPIGALLELADQLFEVGRKLFTSLWDGFKSVWEDIKSWVKNAVSWIGEQFSNWGDSAQSLQTPQGSYASGLDYVPRDMLVKVHEGESINTKQQTSQLSEQQTQKTEQTINLQIDLDGSTLARKLYKYNKDETNRRGTILAGK